MKVIDTRTVLSADRLYRYALWRTWDFEKGFVVFIGLNPSTADETSDDATIRRCIGFAKDWDYGALCMMNLFAFRATKPEDMKRANDPVGPDNDGHLRTVARSAGLVIAAWGTDGVYMQRDQAVKKILPNLSCLKLTKDGHPGHPLYLPKASQPFVFTSQYA